MEVVEQVLERQANDMSISHGQKVDDKKDSFVAPPVAVPVRNVSPVNKPVSPKKEEVPSRNVSPINHPVSPKKEEVSSRNASPVNHPVPPKKEEVSSRNASPVSKPASPRKEEIVKEQLLSANSSKAPSPSPNGIGMRSSDKEHVAPLNNGNYSPAISDTFEDNSAQFSISPAKSVGHNRVPSKTSQSGSVSSSGVSQSIPSVKKAAEFARKPEGEFISNNLSSLSLEVNTNGSQGQVYYIVYIGRI
jgi:hypothetical protein